VKTGEGEFVEMGGLPGIAAPMLKQFAFETSPSK